MAPASLLTPDRNATWTVTDWLAWIAAGVAVLALLFVIASDLHERFVKRADTLARQATHPLD